MVTDPIADMLTRVRNGIMAGHDKVGVPASRVKTRIAEILKEEGYISNFKVTKDHKQGEISISLKWVGPRESAITGLKRVSKPGRRIYVRKDDLPRVLGGMGVAIISTSKGIVTDADARKSNSGGEVLCYVW